MLLLSYIYLAKRASPSVPPTRQLFHYWVNGGVTPSSLKCAHHSLRFPSPVKKILPSKISDPLPLGGFTHPLLTSIWKTLPGLCSWGPLKPLAETTVPNFLLYATLYTFLNKYQANKSVYLDTLIVSSSLAFICLAMVVSMNHLIYMRKR